MSLPNVQQFFRNTVTIELKDGHKFEGRLKSIDYESNQLELIDIQDLGNVNDKSSIPHDRKIQSRLFESSSINEIFLKDKHFCEVKKYSKQEFWDPVSEDSVKPKPKYEERRYNNNRDRNQDRPKREGKDNYHDNRGDNRNHRNYNNNNNNSSYNNNSYNNKNKRNYEPKGEDRNEAEYR